MRDGFVALASLLRGDEPAEPVPDFVVAMDEPNPEFERIDIVRELGRMRLAASDALERGVARMLESLANDVLARELALRPADVDALVTRALAAYADDAPIEILVAPADAANVAARAGVALRADDSLCAGDLVVRVRDGSFESPLAFRLSRALAAANGPS